MRDFDRLSKEADAVGLRLEVVRGIVTVEASPVYRHQQAVLRIINSVHPAMLGDTSCACVATTDVQIRFPDGSRKRPDVAIFCREPDEQDTEMTLLPEAVVEVLSRDYEAKDLVIGVPFYQQVGVRDIVVLDPETGAVRHWQQGHGEQTYASPINLTLLCGCICTV
jgi:Uma2 family endonuclease